MAELAASLISIMSAGTKVTLVLAQLATDIGCAGKEARVIASEIRCLCTVPKTLLDTIEKVQSTSYYEHCASVTRDMADAGLELFSEILNVMEQLRAGTANPKTKLTTRLYWAAFQKP